MTLEFKKLDEYLDQHRNLIEKTSEFSRATAKALEDYQAAKAEYAAVMRQGVIDNVDVSRKLDDLDVKVAETLKQYERKKREQEAFSAIDTSFVISIDDVWRTWNDEFIPKYREAKFHPIIKKLLEAKSAYLQAAKEYHDAANEIDDMRRDVNSSLGDGYLYKLNPVRIGRVDVLSKYLIDEHTARETYSGYFNRDEIQQALRGGDVE